MACSQRRTDASTWGVTWLVASLKLSPTFPFHLNEKYPVFFFTRATAVDYCNSLVELPKLESVVTTLRNLADNAGRLAGDDAEARDDHIGGDDSAIKNADIVFDDGELADDDVLADVDVASDGSGLDDGSLADEDVVAESEGKVGKRPGARERTG